MNSERPAVPVEQLYRERSAHPESELGLIGEAADEISNQNEFSATEQLVNKMSCELKCALCFELFVKPVTLNESYQVIR